MCDEQVTNLHQMLQTVKARVPIIILQRVEETFPALRESMNSMDLVKHEPGSCSETCPTSSGEAIGIKVEEEVINITEEEEEVINIKEEEEEEEEVINIKEEEQEEVINITEEEEEEVINIKKEEEEEEEVINLKEEEEEEVINIKGEEEEEVINLKEEEEEEVINIKEEEEVINVKEEEVLPEPIIFPVVKTEDESAVNEQVETRCGKHSFRCAVCNKAFSYKSSLVTHQRIRSGEQPYCCAVCNKAFSQKSHLFRHLAYTEESGHTAVLYVIGHSVSRVV